MIIALKTEGDRSGHVKMRRILDVGLPGHRERQHEGMQRVCVEQRIEPILIELEEAHQHQRTRKQVGDVETQPAHHRPRDTNRKSVASSPSISAAPRNSGTRNTRILAIEVSNSTSKRPPIASLAI